MNKIYLFLLPILLTSCIYSHSADYAIIGKDNFKKEIDQGKYQYVKEIDDKYCMYYGFYSTIPFTRLTTESSIKKSIDKANIDGYDGDTIINIKSKYSFYFTVPFLQCRVCTAIKGTLVKKI